MCFGIDIIISRASINRESYVEMKNYKLVPNTVVLCPAAAQRQAMSDELP